ncbi:MAG: GIY-YIG nuclease family protein [Candidatus Omnitrophica bacterium]|nr:GIY-YIG nuclease family protein [Candidatus Omnitrophota bacterium]
MYYVYVLESQKDSKHYVGYTNNLERRIFEHNTICNRKKYTSNRGPWELLLYDVFPTKSKAIKHERFLKTGKGREYIKDKIKKKFGV